MRVLVRIFTLILTVVWLASVSQAETIEELQRSGHLQVSYRIATEGEVVQYQPVTLEIEISTHRWFSRGTRVTRFEIDDAVVYRGSEQSTNLSRTEQGQTRAAQLWTLVFYPQKPGTIKLPEIEVFVSVNAESNVVVEGSLTLPEKTLDVLLPEEIRGITDWVATSRLSVVENYQGLKDSYQPGDAITRTITMEAADLPAMMLPAIDVPAIDGLGLYKVPPKVFEKTNRGALLGTRIEETIYTVEQAGRYRLPEYDFYWWNLPGGVKETVHLAARDIVTEGFDASSPTDVENKQSVDLPSSKVIVFFLLATSVVLLVVWVLVRTLLQTTIKQRLIAWHDEKQQAADVVEAAAQGRATDALQMLYKILDSYSPNSKGVTLEGTYQSDRHCMMLLSRLKKQAFSEEPDGLLTKTEAKQLVGFLTRRSATTSPWRQSINLELNRPA